MLRGENHRDLAAQRVVAVDEPFLVVVRPGGDQDVELEPLDELAVLDERHAEAEPPDAGLDEVPEIRHVGAELDEHHEVAEQPGERLRLVEGHRCVAELRQDAVLVVGGQQPENGEADDIPQDAHWCGLFPGSGWEPGFAAPSSHERRYCWSRCSRSTEQCRRNQRDRGPSAHGSIANPVRSSAKSHRSTRDRSQGKGFAARRVPEEACSERCRFAQDQRQHSRRTEHEDAVPERYNLRRENEDAGLSLIHI